MKDAAAPSGTPLPVEPARPFPLDDQGRSAPLHWRPEPIPVVIVGFDVTFITPVLIHGGQNYSAQASRRDGGAAPGRRIARQDRHAAAPGLQQLVRLRGGGAAGIARPRDPEAGGGLLDEGRARRGADTGCPCRRSSASSASRECARSAALSRSRQSTRSSSSTRRRHLVIYEAATVFDPGALGPPCGSVS